MSRPSSYSPEIRERAVRMVAESKAGYGSEFDAIKSIASNRLNWYSVTSAPRLVGAEEGFPSGLRCWRRS
jgi:transposase-like protein